MDFTPSELLILNSKSIEKNNYSRRVAFENGAKKKGYFFEKDEIGNYEDNWLQEAWEIFNLIDLDLQ